MKEKIIYVWDPLCGWCYGFEPQIEKFQQNFNNQYNFEVLVGGMVLPPNGNTMGQMREFLTGAIPQLEKTTGITIAQAYYDNILSNDDLKLYSITPCLVFNYLKSDYQGKETTLARTIQDLLYKQGYNTNELETYRSLIEETDHNFDDASLQIQSQKNIDATYAMFKRAKELGVTGYPTVLLEQNESIQSLSRGYTTYQKLQKQLPK